ncbi:YqaJ viral recombinase family protein [Candidatus Pacearchaeota archaeon]|nr:YqaJ viral recombinase family protein [Candidatus Pacearchaeota archaeon]
MGSTPSLISASRGAAILGQSKYKSPLEVYLEIQEERKQGYCGLNGFLKPERIDPWIEPLNPKHAALRFGLAFEDSICDLVGGVTDREKFYTHPNHDFITCHIDGLKKHGNTQRLQENKTAFDMVYRKNWGDPGTDMIPADYQIQVHHQSMCSGITGIDVNVLVFPRPPAEWEKMGYKITPFLNGNYGITFPDKTNVGVRLSEWAENLQALGYFHKYHIEANPTTQQDILERYLAFWNDNILKEVPPPVNGYDDIKWLIDSPCGEIEADEETRALWSELCDIEKEAEAGRERVAEIKNNFTGFVQREMENIKISMGVCPDCEGEMFLSEIDGMKCCPCQTCNGTGKIQTAEKNKLRIMAGNRNIFTISKPAPGIKVSRPTVTTLKEDSPELYETMKKTSFLDIMPEELELTEKQKEKVNNLDEIIKEVSDKLDNQGMITQKEVKQVKEIKKEQSKILKSFKLTKLLSKDSIIRNLKKTKPEIFDEMFSRSLIEETAPHSRMTVNCPKED